MPQCWAIWRNDEGIGSLIALDWGTSSLRAYLLGDNGAIIDHRALPWGIMATPGGDFAKALETAAEAWRRRQPDLPMIAAGMIGQRTRLARNPICRMSRRPAGTGRGGGLQLAAADFSLPIVPGVIMDGDIPDVMRGEETQIVGALDLAPHLYDTPCWYCRAPRQMGVGEDGKIVAFNTYLTGNCSQFSASTRSSGARPSMRRKIMSTFKIQSLGRHSTEAS